MKLFLFAFYASVLLLLEPNFLCPAGHMADTEQLPWNLPTRLEETGTLA